MFENCFSYQWVIHHVAPLAVNTMLLVSFSLFQIFHVNVVCIVKSLPVKREPDLWHGP